MMKTSNKMLILMAAAIGILAVSCTRNPQDDPSQDSPGYNSKEARTIAEWVEEGVEVDMQSHVVELNVKADGEWGVTPDPDDKWLAVNSPEASYKGSKRILLCIDENRSEVDRSSTLLAMADDGDIYEIPVRQNYNFNGEPPTNGSGVAFTNSGVGYGVDYDYVLDTKSIAKRNFQEDVRIANKQMKEEERTQFSPTKVKKNNPIFNIDAIQKLMSPEYGSKLGAQAYVENPIPFVDLYAQMMDSTVAQAKTVDLSLELGIAFGCIEFVASAGYQSQAHEDHMKMDYTIVRNAPVYNVTISEAEIARYAQAAMYDEQIKYDQVIADIEKQIASFEQAHMIRYKKPDLTKAQQRYIDGKWAEAERPKFGNVLSASFADIYWDLYNAVAFEDDEKIDQIMTKVDDYYGPFYISGGDFGGCLTIHSAIENLTMDGFAKAEGSLDADLGGAFKVRGTFEYTEDGMKLLRDANARFYIYGGDTRVADQLTQIMFGEEPTNRDAWFEALSYWIDSMYSGDEVVLSKAAPISFTITPVWNLFWDEEMHNIAKDWFLNEYKDRGIYEYFGIMNGEYTGGAANDILDRVTADLRDEGYDV